MPIEWKTTRIRDTIVHHWKNQNPHEILAALREKPIESKGYTPPVYRHRMGKINLAVRELPDRTNDIPRAGRLFAILKNTQQRRIPIVEIPVAIIKEPKTRDFKVVTIWKKGTINLDDWMRSRPPSEEIKLIGLTIAKRLAQLHATGYEHGHLKLDNFVITEDGKNVQLVDYTHMSKIGEKSTIPNRSSTNGEGEAIAYNVFGPIAEAATLHMPKLKRGTGISEQRTLFNKLWNEYRKWYDHYSGIKEKG